MPLHIMTPIRQKFCHDVREMFLEAYKVECSTSDQRIISLAMLYDICKADDPDIDIIILELLDQHLTLGSK